MDSATSPSVHGIEHGHLLESLTNSASEPISKGLHAKLCDWADTTKKKHGTHSERLFKLYD